MSMGAGRPWLMTRVDKAASLEVGGKLWHLARKLLLHAPHVLVAADAVVFFQAGLDKRRVHGGVGGVDRGEIGIDADIGDDHVEILRRHDAADHVFDLGDVVVADFKPRAAWHAHIDDELAGIGARKVGAAEKGKAARAE